MERTSRSTANDYAAYTFVYTSETSCVEETLR